MKPTELIVIGASARAAAFSAARAGYSPWWIDQFGDADLRAVFPGRCVPARDYPDGILEAMAVAPQAPWLFTGALENHLPVLGRIAAARTLLGNGRETCERVRSPWQLQSCLQKAGIPFPETPPFDSRCVPGGGWIVKPLRSAGGLGIRPALPEGDPAAGFFLQQRVRGESVSAVFVADGRDAALLGVTRQLVGLPEFHAAEFSYCGSIGPLPLTGSERQQWLRIGEVLATEFGLKGLFGVDAIRADNGIAPVEVNPRYTASVEVLERALDISAIRIHVAACGGELSSPPVAGTEIHAGKAYLFAPHDLEFHGPAALLDQGAAGGESRCADIPVDGMHIAAGAPILTLLANAGSAEACFDLLCAHARRIYNLLGV